MRTIGRIRPARPGSIAILLLSLALFVSGCSGGPGGGGQAIVDSQGNHPAAFASTHPTFAVANVDQCKSCHGDDLSGGIANTSCFTAACHHGTVPGWATPAVHGATAKRAPGSSGFQSCQICHASDFTGDGSQVSCLNNAACHGAGIQAPHPAKPWLASSGLTHTTTDPANAPVCARCHFPGSANNPANHPATPASPGTEPGCFNNTLCHGEGAAPHALGSAWSDPAVGGSNFHGLPAKQDLAYCQSCHGTPGSIRFNGGVASTSCAGCHPDAGAHPVRWYQAPQPFPGYVTSHRDSGNRSVACAICHDVTQGRTPPDSASPSCFSASFQGVTCHANGPGNAPHVADLFLDHTGVTQATFTDPFPAGCSACHAVSGTSPLSAAPTCTTCHGEGVTGSITARSPLTNRNCTSCHARPPSGSLYPNVAGRHSGHVALNGAGTPVDCDTCHAGLGSGSAGHYNRANARPGKSALRVPPGDAAFGTTYAAKSAALGFNSAALTCSGVSCHGGQTTPNWQTGTINVDFDSGPGVTPASGCRQCHVLGTAQGIPEYNSPYSGLHQKHLEQIPLSTGGNALCTECHDMANGSTGANRHFLFLSTRDLLEGPASDTVNPADKNLAVPAGTYTASTQTCNVTCHGITHSDFSWTGGANHAIPFLDTRHTTMDATNFPGDCGACHTVGPASPSSSPPTCQTCHQAGSPLASTGCTSCHASPPDSTSTAAYPNVEGGHSEHNGLGGMTGNCSACHTGLANGSLAHYNRANARTGQNALRVPPGDVSIVNTYFAKPSGTVAAFNNTAFTCSNVNCHGGIVTPNWQTGTINVDFDSGPGVTPVSGCRQCHTLGTASGTPQNNSAWSGLHQKHLQGISSRPGGNALCTECHDMANGTTGANRHFTDLDTAVMEGPASQTVEPDDKSTTVPAGTYTASTRTCTVTCHTQDHSGWRWESSEANHALGSVWTDPNPSFHGLTAKSDLTACQSCHNQAGTIGFSGGSATTSCAGCHTEARAHPVRWHQAPQGFPNYATSHRDSGNRNVACALCHDVTQGRTAPDSAAPSCFSATFKSVGCHSGGPGAANHSVPNLDASHTTATQDNFNSNCSSCHSDTGTSPVSAAPNCVSCHTNFASSNPLTTKNCTSCHADPPNGTVYPNIARKHAKHNALAEVAGVCSACHNGLDPGAGASARLAHYTRAKSKTAPGDVAFLSVYNAKNATASFGSLSCSNVSCHGGQTISWDTGSINVNTDGGCNQCHRRRSVSDQWNSPFSGEHGRNQHVNAGCTACHNTTKLADPAVGRHFLALSTQPMEVRGSVTIAGGTTKVVTYTAGGAVGTGSCTPQSGVGCHGTKSW